MSRSYGQAIAVGPTSIEGSLCFSFCNVFSCWCVTRHGAPAVKSKSPARFYYKKDGVRLHCVEVPPRRGERPPLLATTAEPRDRPGSPFEPPVNDEGPVVISKGEAAAANIPIHFQIVE